MSRVCEVSGKKPGRGNKRSHALNATKRIFRPNLVEKKVRIWDEKMKKFVMKKMKLSTSALRTLDKRG